MNEYKNANGNKAVDYLDIVAWRSTAEFVSKYFTKGRMAVVDGRLPLTDWTDRDGNKRRSAEIVANSVHFGDSKPQNQNQASLAPSCAAAGVRAGGRDLGLPVGTAPDCDPGLLKRGAEGKGSVSHPNTG